MPLDPATRAFVDRAAANATKPRHEMSPAEARAAMSALGGILAPGPALPRVEDLEVPVAGAVLPTRLYVPGPHPNGLLVYFHGGGWVVGSIAEFDPLCRELARCSGCAIAAVDYRRAPEHPYPGPIEDAWAALTWLANRRGSLLGVDLPLLVGGDSAGASLAIAVTRRANQSGVPVLKAQLLAYPVTDCDFERPSYRDPANQLTLTREAMMWYWNHYAPDQEARSQVEAAPVRAPDLAGLPPAVIITAEYDVLRDEGEEYAERLREAGVKVIHRRFAGQMHAFLMMIGLLPGSEDGIRFASQGLRELLTETAP